jgi:hypothetical protein
MKITIRTASAVVQAIKINNHSRYGADTLITYGSSRHRNDPVQYATGSWRDH